MNVGGSYPASQPLPDGDLPSPAVPARPACTGRGTGRRGRRRPGGFSLVELVLVVAILAIIAAMAMGRMGRSVDGANQAAHDHNATTLQRAIELYRADHGRWPDVGEIKDQLKKYTDAAGVTNNQKTARFVYGPYLREIPTVMTGPTKGRNKIAAADGSGVGWLYDQSTGAVRVNPGTP